jgi:hypothetical protein
MTKIDKEDDDTNDTILGTVNRCEIDEKNNS